MQGTLDSAPTAHSKVQGFSPSPPHATALASENTPLSANASSQDWAQRAFGVEQLPHAVQEGTVTESGVGCVDSERLKNCEEAKASGSMHAKWQKLSERPLRVGMFCASA